MFRWDFSHGFTLITILLFSEILFIQHYFPQLSSSTMAEVVFPVIEKEMCGHHCPFHPTICYILGYLDTIVENYFLTIIVLALIAKILNNLPQQNIVVWLIVHIVSLVVFGIAIFSFFNLVLTTPWFCKIAQRLLKSIFSLNKTELLFLDNVLDEFNKSSFKETINDIQKFSYKILDIVGFDKPIIFIVCGLMMLFRITFSYTNRVIIPVSIIVMSSITFKELFIESGFFMALLGFIISALIEILTIYVILYWSSIVFFPIFTYSAFSMACRFFPFLILFGVSEDLSNFTVLAIFIWLVTWMYCWSNSKTNLASVVVTFIGISQIFSNFSIEYLVFIFLLSELFTHQVNASI